MTDLWSQRNSKKGNVAVNMYLSVDKQKTAKMIYDKSDELNIKAVDNSLQRNGDSFDFVSGTGRQRGRCGKISLCHK